MISPTEIHQQAAKDKVKVQIVEKDYVLTWFLLALSQTPEVQNTFRFKGGTCIRKIYDPDWRYSEDLDFTVTQAPPNSKKIDAILANLSEKASELSGLVFKSNPLEGNVTYIEYVGPLQKTAGMRKFKIDLTWDEILVDPPIKKKVQGLFSDQKGQGKTLPVYSLEEICAEKTRSLLQRREPRDLYDIWRLMNERSDLDRPKIKDIFEKKCEFKKMKLIQIQDVLGKHNLGTLEKMWNRRLSDQVLDLPHFDQVVRETKRALKDCND